MQCFQIKKDEWMIILTPYRIQFSNIVVDSEYNNNQVKKIYAISNRSYAIFQDYVIEWGSIIFKHNQQQDNQEDIQNNQQNVEQNNQNISKMKQSKQSFAIIPIKVNQLSLGTKHTFASTINTRSTNFNHPNYFNQPNQSNQLQKYQQYQKYQKQQLNPNNDQQQNNIQSNNYNQQQHNKSSVYCWGSNSNYQLGLQHQKQYGLIKVDLFDQALQAGLTLNQITCGQNHTLALFQDQQSTQTKLFGWGQSKSYQLALDTTSIVPYPVDIQYQFTSSISKIYSKSDYNIAITNKNQLYSWGSNMFNRLGLNPPKKQSHIKPQSNIQNQFSNKLNQQNNIPQISTNSPNTSRQTMNFSKDSINQQDISFTDRRTTIVQKSVHNNIQKVKIPKKIQISNKKIKSIALGTYHVIALTLQGECFTWGNGIYGQLGNNKFGQFSPQQISTKHLSTNIKFIKCAAGEQHSCLLDQQGNAYTCGSNSYGVLGHQKHESQSKKKRCKIFQKIQYFQQNKIKIGSISSGDRHILVHSQDSQVYGWGYNKNNEVILKINEGYNNNKQRLDIKQVEQQNYKDSKLQKAKNGRYDNEVNVRFGSNGVRLQDMRCQQIKSEIRTNNNRIMQNSQQIRCDKNDKQLNNRIRNERIDMDDNKQQQIDNSIIQLQNKNNDQLIQNEKLREWKIKYNNFILNKRKQQDQLIKQLNIILLNQFI